MTHEELLANIDHYIKKDNGVYLGLILSAVAELHKPKIMGAGIFCSICYWDDLGYAIEESYPCTTIQTIEKELL